jgi:2-(1,2-epoxy-1,2-dihydrophenyl)acetyl-CoA isomerase
MALILYETADGVATITLNRAEKLNAFAGTMRDDLLKALQTAGRSPEVGAVIITGAGRGFSAGGDVEAMAAMQREDRTGDFEGLLQAGTAITLLIRTMPKAVIAAVNGVAAGAGCNLALACDLRVASTAAKIGATFVRIGMHPDWGGTFFLPRIVGTSRALEMLWTGRMIEAEEALAIGLFDQVVAPETLLTEAKMLAMRIAAGPRQAIADMKAAVYASFSNSLEAQLQLERENQLRAFASEDAREGITGFLEKRDPRFSGR